MEVGDYVRTNLGNIGKIIKEYTHKKGNVEYPEPQEWVLDNGYSLNEALMFESNEEIVKCSKDLIDLIEVNDYVNGYKVIKINEPSLANDYKRIIYCNECEGLYQGIFTNEDIKSIVTKEQFKSIEYTVKE